MYRLIFAPHADDEVFGCGGLIARYSHECAVVVAAAPDETRLAEFEEAKKILGYGRNYFLNIPDGRVGEDPLALVSHFDRMLNHLQPGEVYLPYPSMHQDHIAVYEAGLRACRTSMNAGHWYPNSVFVYDVAAYDVTLYPSDLRWNVFQELTEGEVDLKVQALAAYESQQTDSPHPVNGVKEAAHTIGAARQVPYAEQFALVRQVRS
jgi:LmbE family N-acetylglucosaminyl deacetylase